MGMWYGRGSKYGSRSASTGELLLALSILPAGALLILGISAAYVHSPAGQEAKKRSIEEMLLKDCIKSEFARRDFTIEQLQRKGWAQKVVTDYCEAT